MYFPSKRNLVWSTVCWGLLLAIWITFASMIIGTTHKWSVMIGALDFVVFSCLFLATWILGSCGYTITDNHLIARMGPICRKVLLRDIQLVRWSSTFLNRVGVIGLSGDMLYIRLENDFLNISPKDVNGFLNLLRERCPNAEIQVSETPPRLFATVTDKELVLDVKENENLFSNKWLVSIAGLFPFLFLGFILGMILIFR